MPELLKKIEVFLKRTKKLHAEKKAEIRLGKILFLPAELKIITPSVTIDLTQKEADILYFLCLHRDKVLKRNEVLLNVWGKEDYFLGRSMDVFISRIRKYLKDDPVVVLETVHGVGFRLMVKGHVTP